MSVEIHWVETEAVLVAPVGCVMKRPFGCHGAWVLCGWAEAGGNGKISDFWDHVLPMEYPDVGAGPLRECGSVQAVSRSAFSFWERHPGREVRVRSASQTKRSELAPPARLHFRDLMQFEGDPI